MRNRAPTLCATVRNCARLCRKFFFWPETGALKEDLLSWLAKYKPQLAVYEARLRHCSH